MCAFVVTLTVKFQCKICVLFRFMLMLSANPVSSILGVLEQPIETRAMARVECVGFMYMAAYSKRMGI